MRLIPIYVDDIVIAIVFLLFVVGACITIVVIIL